MLNQFSHDTNYLVELAEAMDANCGSGNSRVQRQQEQQLNTMRHFLPSEILTIIFRHFDVADRNRMALVCTAWRDAVYCKCMWLDVEIRMHDRRQIPVLVKRGISRVKVDSLRSVDALRDIIKCFPMLETLNLSRCRITKSMRIIDAPLLLHLNLSHCTKLDDDTFKGIIPHVKQLETLDLSNCPKITGVSLQLIASELGNLTNLDLSTGMTSIRRHRVGISDRRIEYLAKMSSLKELNLASRKTSDYDLQHLTNLSQLKKLNLSRCVNIMGNGIEYLKNLPNLQQLDLSNCYNLNDTAFKHLANLLNLKKLSLSSCVKISDDGLKDLMDLSTLEELNLRYCKNITNDGLRYVSNIHNLKKLFLNCCEKISDVGIRRLIKLVNLEELDLNNCINITNYSLYHMSYLHNLKQLSLICCDKLSDDGIKHLMVLSNLQELDLSDCKNITNDGLRYLSDLDKLKKLSLRSCLKISDDGIDYLRLLVNLNSLNLSFCNITDRSLGLLEDINLRELNLCGCWEISPSGITEYLANQTCLRILRLCQSQKDGINDFEGIQIITTMFMEIFVPRSIVR